MINVVSDFRAYFYDVFVAKADFWLIFGVLAQLLFTARFVVQWIVSERMGKSVVPLAFWFLSMGGGIMLLVYGLVRREPIIILGQGLAVFIYMRNLVLIFRPKKKTALGGQSDKP
ncbi:MAG: lipid-A-disaccharide synthase N-terminal domain-containing protein [Beijerinckiaceae bacterium]